MLLSLAFALLVGEILARVLRPVPFTRDHIWSGFDDQLRGELFVPDPDVGYRPGPAWAPNGRFGFRNGAEYDDSSGPAINVVLLGDSLIQDGVLGEVLKERLAGRPVRVWIAGIGGYNTLQEAHYLEHWIKLKPDVLLLGFCLNDFSRSMVVVRSGRADERRFVTPDFEPLAAVNPVLFRYSALYRLFESALIWRGVRGQFSPEGVRHNRENVRRGLEQIKDYTARRGIPFLVILYPHLVEIEAPWQREAHQQAREIFVELGLRWVDVTEDYAARGPLALRRSSDDPVHPNHEGHEIAARRLLAALPDVLP